MKETFIFHILIFCLSALGHVRCIVNPTDTEVDGGKRPEKKYEFEIQTVKHFWEKIRTTNEEKLRKHHFNKLNDLERMELCNAAKDFAGFDGMQRKAEIHKPIECGINFERREDPAAIVIKCETIPVSYLLLDETVVDAKKIKIFIRANKYDDKEKYSFVVRPIESKAEQNSVEVSPEETVTTFLEETRLQICIAAKNRLAKELRPELKSNEIGKPSMFQMKFVDPKKEETHAALDCNSEPVMYVYLHEMDEETIQIALLTKTVAN